MTNKPTFTLDAQDGPERIAKHIARAGVCSRREAEARIADGRVTVNGELITSPALNVTAADNITVDGKPLPALEPSRLWRYHKPRGLVVSARDEKDRQTIFDTLPASMPRVLSVGRLDMDSEGLLLLTDDGKFTNELLGRGHPKRYWALVSGQPGAAELEAMARGGLHIRGRETLPASVRRLSPAEIPSSLPPHRESAGREARSTWLELILHEGMNRQVRKITKHAGHTTIRLVRAGVGRLRLEDLGLDPGEYRPIRPSDCL